MYRLWKVMLDARQPIIVAPSFHADFVINVATWALELLTVVADLDLFYVLIGLSSSICGAIRVRDLLGLRTEIIGVQSAGVPAYAVP
jgi:threonine dehydratase